MIRLAALIWSVVAVVLAVTVFQIKYAVQELEGELVQVNAQIVQDQEAIHVLRAEWSYLNQPERIAGLAERYLGLDPAMEPQRVSLNDLGNLPLRLEGVVIRAADAGPLLPKEKPGGLLYVSAPAPEAPRVEIPEQPRAQFVSAGPRKSAPAGSVAAPAQSSPDPIAATLIKYGGAQ